jgi:CHAT domain-containing protein
VDSFDFTYLTSGRELLPRAQDTAPSGSIVVVADPDFTGSFAPAPLPEAGGLAQDARSASVDLFFSEFRGDLTERPWVPLPGTRWEAKTIQQLFPQAQLFLGADATKQQLLRLSAPGVLHLATHGFFLDDASAQEASRAVGHFGALGDALRMKRTADPLLRSGLVLAGVRSSRAGENPEAQADSALVTALELAGLNLWGTQLVVLSACDTGRGEFKRGQGVYGLRRAFVVAGAETVVMSLWKVNDDTTSELMEAYYRNLLAGQGRSAALNQAMRSLLASRPHPHYWAPFIALGKDAPLLGYSPRP